MLRRSSNSGENPFLFQILTTYKSESDSHRKLPHKHMNAFPSSNETKTATIDHFSQFAVTTLYRKPN